MALVRSIVSAVVATCFALSVASWGQPAVCSSQMTLAGQHQRGPHEPSSPQHQHPASQTCAVHLCCALLVLPTPVALSPARLGKAPADPGFTAVSAVAAPRPAHALPFAQAPPSLS